MGGRYEDRNGRHPEVLSDLRTELRRAAQEHRPDRERMLARVERGMSAPEPGPRRGHRSRYGPAPWARVVSVTAGLVGAFGIGGLAVGLTVNSGDAGPQTVVSSPGPASSPAVPSATASPTRRPVTPPSGRASGSPSATGKATDSASAQASSTPTTSPDVKRGNHPQDGYLWSDGSIDKASSEFWAQSNVTVKSTGTLSGLVVELRVVKTDEVASTGSWSTLNSDDYEVKITEDDDALVYRWTLKPGKTLAAGTYVFAGQYNHAKGGRDAGGDAYAAQGDGPDGAVEVRGDFY